MSEDCPSCERYLHDHAEVFAELAALREECEKWKGRAESLKAGVCACRFRGENKEQTDECMVHAKLREKCERLHEAWGEDAVRAETYREGLEEIQGSCEAYPEGVFPEMEPDDWTRVRFILENAGYTLDRLSASYLRMHKRHHLGIARETLEKGEKLNTGGDQG